MRKRQPGFQAFLRVLAGTGICLWWLAMAMFLMYSSSKPQVPQPQEGRTYDINNHGSVVYLTKSEYYRMWGIGFSGLAMTFAGIGVELWMRKTRSMPH
jgi:hypothetical protein